MRSRGVELASERHEILAQIEQATKKKQMLQNRKRSLASPNGEFYSAALEVIAQFLKEESEWALEERARASKDREDDRLVEQIEEIAEDIRDLERKMHDIAAREVNYTATINLFSDLEMRFMRSDYESPRSHFASRFRAHRFFKECKAGELSLDDAWDVLKKFQYFKKPQSRRAHSPIGSHELAQAFGAMIGEVVSGSVKAGRRRRRARDSSSRFPTVSRPVFRGSRRKYGSFSNGEGF